MKKIKIGPKTILYPMPAVMIGANVNGKPNYLTIAYCGIIYPKPPMFAFVSLKSHYTNSGIKENGTFSVNIPSEEMLKITDYVGIYSGRDIDKATLFKQFYGTLNTAPMITDCPVNLECRLFQTLDIGGISEIFLGEIMETYVGENYLTGGMPDLKKINPIIFSMYDKNYWRVGEHLGKAWSVGKDLKSKK